MCDILWHPLNYCFWRCEVKLFLLQSLPIVCPKTSVTKCQSAPRNIAEDRRSHVRCNGNLKTPKFTSI